MSKQKFKKMFFFDVRVTVSIIIVLTLMLPTSLSFAVPVQWAGNGHWYEAVYVPGGISWTDAKNAASSVLAGGYLATISSEAENTFVFSLIDEDKYWYYGTPNGGSFGPWLGGTYQESEGVWQWVTGELWDYTNWFPGQPDNWMGVENYLHFYVNVSPSRAATWNDLSNWPLQPVKGIYGYVVETVPEPSSFMLLSATVLYLVTQKKRIRK
jgi:hypothetical protein